MNMGCNDYVVAALYDAGTMCDSLCGFCERRCLRERLALRNID